MLRQAQHEGDGCDGFSLIEALVALVVLAVSLLVIFGAQERLADGRRRYDAALVRAEAERDLLSVARELNPTAEPAGVVELDGGEAIRWSSRPLSPERRNRAIPTGQGAFALRLYRVELVRGGAAGRPTTAISVDRVGWRRLDAPPPAAAAAAPPAGAPVQPPAR